MSMKLGKIVEQFEILPFYIPEKWEDYEIDGIIDDNRLMRQNYIFLASKGEKVHPIVFADKAISMGMKAIFTDKFALEEYLNNRTFVPVLTLLKNNNIPIFIVDNLYEKQASIAKFIFDNPSSGFKKFAVTGTNGKTTTSYIYTYLLKLLGYKTGLIGTIEIDDGEKTVPSTLTTPQGARLQQLFSDMKNNNVDYLSMEVSSHAITLGRVDGVKYDVGAFTNLTQDHLDFHSTMDEYFATKEKLFTEEHCSKAVICIDDEYGLKLYTNQKRDGVYSFSTCSDKDIKADFYIDNISYKKSDLGLAYTLFDLYLPAFLTENLGEKITITTDMQGDFNVSNIGLAVSSVFVSDVDVKAFAQLLKTIVISPAVPGRMEKISDNPLVIVDFAHNPGSMQTLFESFAARFLLPEAEKDILGEKASKLICVFGADGKRDIGKRPIMAELSVKYCDKTILTNGELYGEDQHNILKDTLQTLSKEIVDSKIIVELDREKAIFRAIREAKDNDIVLILGRGHEIEFELPDGSVIDLDDRQVARNALEERNV
ncbi:UDP-N-acetylmuramoyl-L-alanyl-D-glutamate--2,6-diaminopimelate ligase [Actinomyces sp. zg-332]|uniref:Mur ligase family protein n=1 Tax=Actinomyces sp. zg-332 TaxID=2708340 RepID=UPI00141D9426|nr:UDP-N-acetylmuramoyl-L-alanyl-D-glutamate--2,6-diaminopimelate ligase [Actinomyces sp. zg-332]QPK94422.1 UDP-N-acetylmuramoyl-L-alanyl-D-glutamate--2,6-diaminopimelate ligase [Actinomyces sp. zg-332]